jgi:surface antigen
MIGIMTSIFRLSPGFVFSLVLTPSLFLYIAGCVPVTATQPQSFEAPVTMGPAKLPEYTAGTTFVYSNGTWDRVVEANSSFVIWENNLGYRSLGSTDFSYRPAKWEGKGIKGYRTFAPTAYVYSEADESLWPLSAGKRTHYDEKNKWGVPGIYERHSNAVWKCTVKGTERVRVPAGTFDTWEIACSRYSVPLRGGRAKRWEDKTFHYAPSIGHWVILEQDFLGARANIRKELVAVLPSLSSMGVDKTAAIGIKEHFQQTLGTSPSGEMTRWSDDNKKISFSMTPVATYRLADGTPCRQYEQRLDLGWQSKMYYGIACRSESGLWAVPRR